jgi:aldose 1-epimerase
LTSNAVYVIGNDQLELGLVPEAGGSWTSLRVRKAAHWVDIMRPASARSLRDGDRLGYANWPIVPYSNRIANGLVRCLPGRLVQLPANAPAISPHILHGHGWLRPWAVEARTADSITMAMQLEAGQFWPWRHRMEQTISVRGVEAESWLSVTNLDSQPMPVGLGWHTYFPRTPECSITARLPGIWWASPDGIPNRHAAVPDSLDMARGARLADLPAGDNCYTGWDGVARLAWPENDVIVEMTAAPSLFGHIVFYNPAGTDFYCFEPVSHSTNAPNLEPEAARAEGVRILAPGEVLSGSFKLRVV